MDGSAETPTQQPVKPAGKLVQFGVLLGVLPIFPPMFGFQFLPSAEWALKASGPSYVAGILFAIVLFQIVRRRIDTVSGDLKKIAAVLGSPLIGFLLGKNIVAVAGPMMVAVIVGYNVELLHVVEDGFRSGSRGCRSPVSLQGLPFLFDRLCGVENGVRFALQRGSRIAVVGRGTSYGTFVRSVRRVD
jgi:hypothetical protein